MNLKKLFTEHPNSVDETYLEHMWFALRCGTKLFLVGLACLIHAFFPFMFTTTASDTVIRMYDCLKQRNPNYRDR